MKDLILFGMQGSGKGTQAGIIAEKFGYQLFEAGAELRRLASSDTPLGQKVKSIIDAGNLVPDEVIMEIVEAYVRGIDVGQAVIFDGIPRNQSQATLFATLMEKVGRDPYGLHISLTEEEAMARLTRRRMCSGCKKVFPATFLNKTCSACGKELTTRADDNPESIRVRLHHFREETVPVIDTFRKHNHIIEVDGNQSVELVTAAISEKLQSL